MNLNFKCPINCGETFDFIEFKLHQNLCKNLKDIYRCTLCDQKFEIEKSQDNFNQLNITHRKLCEKLNKFCIYCNKKFSFLDYENHLKTCEDVFYLEKYDLMVCKKYPEAHENICMSIKKLCLSIKKIYERSQEN